MDVYSMRMNIVENGVLDSAGDNLLTFFGLKLYNYQLAAEKKIPQKRSESKRRVRNDNT